MFGVLAFASGPCAGMAAQPQSNPQESPSGISSTNSPAELARQGAAKQEQIQSSSQKLGNELAAMIDEYERNGLNGDETKNLKSLKGVISRLSDTDMEKIVALLRSAAEPSDGKTTITAISGAYAQQKGVLVQLKQILASYAAEQEALELADNVRQLADRQAANLQAGIETAQWSLAGAKPAEGAVEASLQAQQAEQKAIAEESKIFQDKIRSFAKKTGNKEVAERFNKGIEDISKIVPNLEAAADSLAGKKLFEAVGNEKTARDQMRQLARTITPPREASELLREASLTLDKLISQQKAMLATTKETQAKPIEQWLDEELKKKKNWQIAQLAKNPETAGLLSQPIEKMVQAEPVKKIYESYIKTVMEPLSGMEDREGDMANQADILSQDLDKTAKPAAELLRSATPPMRDARTALNGRDANVAAKHEETAIVAMEKAKASLDQQLAAAEKSEALAGDKAGGLKEIQKQTQELKAEQAALAKTTAAPKTPEQAAAATKKQADLQQKAAQLQQQAAADAPAAAATLGAAASNMKQAAAAMSNAAQTPQAQAQQQQAAQNLEKAGQQLDQQINKLAQAQQDLDAAGKALQDLAVIIEAEQKLQLDTVQAAPAQLRQPATIKALAPRQTGIQNDTVAFQKTATAPDAQQPLKSAASHMGSAQGNLENANAKLAESDEQKALADLYSIKKALEAQSQSAQQQLGTPPPAAAATAAAAQAATAVAQAQAQLGQAMQQMAQAGAPQAGDPPQAGAPQPGDTQAAAAPLAAAAQEVGKAAAQATGLPQDASKAMQAATGALAKAAGEAAAGKGQEAQADGSAAQAALAQAASALAQAQAGIAGGPPAPGAPPGPPGSPDAPGMPGPSSGDGKGSQGDGGNAQAGGHKTAGKGQFLGLPARDRAAIQQAQSEKYPQQYATKVEQYLQNLADESSRH